MGGALDAVAPDLSALHWLATDETLPDPDGWRAPPIDADTLALLQYTSGSTSSPKGVMLLHGNVVHNLHQAHERSRIEPHHVNVGWLPPYHDMGLVGLVLCPLAERGCPVVLMSPLSFLRRPRRWLEALTRFRGTHTVAPDFAFELCVRTTSPAQRAALDLSPVVVAMSGSEPVRKHTIDRFTQAFAPAGFRREAFFPCYGLAETTVMATAPLRHADPTVRFFRDDELRAGRAVATQPGEPGARSFVGCGAVVADSRLAIVDEGTGAELPPGKIGEIWLRGPGVSPGYWGKPEATALTFGAHLVGGGDQRFLRTGDLGFIDGGELFVCARIKDLIKLRGRAYFPSDIEATVERAHPLLRAGGAAAVSGDDGESERLVLVAEISREASAEGALLDGAAISLAIQAAMADEHQIAFDVIALVRAGAVPKTSSGKIQRFRCREAILAGNLDALYWQPPR
jgi:acyl-CoA synthetase (AMP-forming)/AMP-acid ligase II